MHARSFLAWLVVGGSAVAQGVVRPVPFDPAERGIEGRGQAGQVEVLARGQQRIVLSRPVRGWEIAELDDGRWVILAGGVEPGLDIYLFDPVAGEVIGLPFHVTGGLRLPSTFAAGLGSWPLFESPSLFVLAVERRGRIRCLAVDASRQVPRELASLDLPMSVRDLRVTHDASSEQVRVEFEGADAVLEFVHPLAPRLLVEPRLVDFGAIAAGSEARRTISLRNGGRRPLAVGASTTPGLELDGGGALWIEPGGAHDLSVILRAPNPGVVRGSVRLVSPVVGATVTIAVRGSVAEADQREPGPPSSDPAATGGRTESVVDRVERPTATDATNDGDTSVPRALSADDVALLEVRRLDELRVIVERLDDVWDSSWARRDPATSLVLRNDATRRTFRFERAASRAVLEGRAGDALSVALASGERTGEFVPFRTLGPTLRIERRTCVVRTAPNGSFLLLSVLIDEQRRPIEVLASVRGRADATGTARIAADAITAAAIAADRAPTHIVAAEAARAPDRFAWSTVVTLDG